MDLDQVVPKFFEMDPETDDLLIDGDQLVDGMVVLVESPELRGYLNDQLSDEYNGEKILRWNRWMTVSELTPDAVQDKIFFIAVYSDGTKKQISVSTDCAWYVKKDSIPLREKHSTPLEEVNDFLMQGLSEEAAEILKEIFFEMFQETEKTNR